jgi:DNA polymerase-3 subunit delta'
MSFRDVIGHRRLVGLLGRSIRQDSLPPSLIFAGPRGVGKRLVALAAAQALNCPHATDNDACGTCSTCTRIVRGVHPAVLIFEPGESGSIKIEQIRDVIDLVAYRPFEGRRRLVIIDDADALVPAAQNALLKTLEEPPSSSGFILVTSRPDTLLATVRSRCQRLRFSALDAEDVATALMRQGRSEPEARAVAATADGSIGRALESASSHLVDARDGALRVLAHAAAVEDPRRRIESAKDLLAKTGGSSAADREQLVAHLRAMASVLRDVELLSARGDARALANADVKPAVERLTAFQGDRGVRAFNAVERALAALDRNAGVKIVADWLVLQL